MTVALAAFPQFLDNSGKPLPGGKLYTYAAGTLTPLPTYTDRGGLTPNSNPVVFDSAGRADVWLQTNVPYDLSLRDSSDNVLDTVSNFYAGADPSQLTTAGIVPATGGDYTGLVNFNGGALFNGTAAQDLVTLDSLNIAAVQTSNLWVNPDGAINQRLATTAADGVPGFDRAIALCETGSVGISQVAQPFDGAAFAMRMTQPDAVAKRIGTVQVVEAKDCLSYRGKNLALALKIRCSAAVTVRCALVAWTGTLDAPPKDVVNTWASTTYTAGNFFIANTLTIGTAAAVLAANTWTDLFVSSTSPGGVVVPSTLNNLYMVFWTDSAITQNVTLDSTMIRCAQGTNAPLWTQPSIAVEMLRAQRDCAKSYAQATALSTVTAIGADQGYGVIGGGITVKVALPVVMRTTPTVSLWSNLGVASQWVAFAAGGGANPYAASSSNISDRNFTVSVTPASGEVFATGQWLAATGF